MTLAVGSTLAKDIVGACTCPAGTIISFTLDENENWVANDNVDTNTEYVFKTAYNATTNKALTESDIGAAAPKGVVTDLEHNTSSTDLPTAATVAAYVDLRTAGLSGLTGAMHFKGNVNELPEATSAETYSTYDAGDVVLGPNNKEYVYDKSASGAASSRWIELGDEGSYALKSSTDTITEVASFTANTLPTLTPVPTTASNVSVTNGIAADLETNDVSIPNVTSAGTMTTASVSGGILNITLGTAPTIAATPITVKEVKTFTANTPTAVTATPVNFDAVSNWNAGTQAALNTNDTIVVVPNSTNS